MIWTQIKALSESKAFWSLNLLLFAVPFLAKLGLPIGYDTFALYVAAILLSISTVLYLTTCPVLTRFESLNDFLCSGRPPEFLREVYGKEVGTIASIGDTAVKTKLTNIHGAQQVDGATFWYVFDAVNRSRPWRRWIVTGFYILVGAILVGVNGDRFYTVYQEVFKQ